MNVKCLHSFYQALISLCRMIGDRQCVFDGISQSVVEVRSQICFGPASKGGMLLEFGLVLSHRLLTLSEVLECFSSSVTDCPT